MGINPPPPPPPPIPPLPGVPAPPIEPLDTTVSLQLYRLATRGHPPHWEIQPAYAKHGGLFPHPSSPPTSAMRPRPSASMAES